MCPFENGGAALGMPGLLLQAQNFATAQASVPCTGLGLLQRRRKLAAPLLVDCCATAEESRIPVASVQGPSAAGAPAIVHLSDRFELMEILGHGSCGVVQRARHKDDAMTVALKIVHTVDEQLAQITRQEYEFLRSIEHPHVIQAFDFFTTMDRAVIVMELFDGVPLDTAVRLSPSKCLSESRACLLFGQLMQAVAYLHRHGILHRDIKGQNVLVTSDSAQPDLRLVDFNVACRLADGSLTPTGTVTYLAPEILAGQSSSQASDIWASGLCLQLMLAGRLPRRFDTFANEDAFAEAVGRRPSDEDCLSERCLAALRSCLDADPEARPNAEELLSKGWLGSGPSDYNAK